jgi:tRNA modification GTPase
VSERRQKSEVDVATRAGGDHRVNFLSQDTIVALATASGPSALAIVRLSGADAERVCRRVVSPTHGWPVRARQATRCRIHDLDDVTSTMDDGLVTMFPAPHSFTGETVIELGIHGGAYVPHVVCAALVKAGARPATPGEFSARAVLNGKLDLLQAEAIADLIEARSRASHRTALHQLSGALSAKLSDLRERLLDLEAMLAFDIDFPEEDGGHLPRERISEACLVLLAQLDALLTTVPAAVLGRNGATVVLAGPVNAGKSSLLNALVGEMRVIVSDAPGTTRDAVEVLLEHDPWPLRLVDTAGLGPSTDPVDRLGMEMSERYLAHAHAVVTCAESTPALLRAALTIGACTAAPLVGALTKRDLTSEREDVTASWFPVIPVSALRGEGLTELMACVTNAIAGGLNAMEPDSPIITRARHRTALVKARRELSAFADTWSNQTLPATLAATHVRAARAALDELVGSVEVEDVFARVFSTFCVGK